MDLFFWTIIVHKSCKANDLYFHKLNAMYKHMIFIPSLSYKLVWGFCLWLVNCLWYREIISNDFQNALLGKGWIIEVTNPLFQYLYPFKWVQNLNFVFLVFIERMRSKNCLCDGKCSVLMDSVIFGQNMVNDEMSVPCFPLPSPTLHSYSLPCYHYSIWHIHNS